MSDRHNSPGAIIGAGNRAAIRECLATHLGISVTAVGRHVDVIRDEWLNPKPDPILTDAEQRAQATRCCCKGADDMCQCQNVPDRITRENRSGSDA